MERSREFVKGIVKAEMWSGHSMGLERGILKERARAEKLSVSWMES